MKNTDHLTKVKKALAKYDKSAVAQRSVSKKIWNYAIRRKITVGLHVITRESAKKLSELGFEVTSGKNKPPYSIKYIVGWKDFLE